MIGVSDFVRVHLIFLDDLNEVEVVTTPPIGSASGLQRIPGIVKGPAQLQSLLEAVGVNSYLFSSGELLRGKFPTLTLCEATPAFIVKSLKEKFDKASAFEIEILSGEHRLQTPVKWPQTPCSLTVCAPSAASAAGVDRFLATVN